LHLKKNQAGGDPFEIGKTDVFKLNSTNVGEISKVNISHDGKGIGAGWFCESVTVKNSVTNQIILYNYRFI
jgi:hypothetical protein